MSSLGPEVKVGKGLALRNPFYLMFRCSAISTRRLPFIWRDTLIKPLTSSFMRTRFSSRKLRSSLPFLISRSSSSSVNGPFRSMTSRTCSCRGRGPQTFSNYLNTVSSKLCYWRWGSRPFSPKPFREFLVPRIIFRRYAWANPLQGYVKVTSRDFSRVDIVA